MEMNIETLIRSLEKAENDNKKFALLLIISKLMKSNKLNDLKPIESNSGNGTNNNNSNSNGNGNGINGSGDEPSKLADDENAERVRLFNERLFKGIGAHFLARLLTTKQSVENCSTLSFKSLALSILTQFLDYPSLICDPILISKLDTICQIILIDLDKKEVDDLTDESIILKRNLVIDTLKYLYALSKYIPDYLCLNTNLAEILMEKIILNENYDKTNRFGLDKFNKIKYDCTDNIIFVSCKLFASICNNNDLIESSNSSTNNSNENKSKKQHQADECTKFKNDKIEKCFRQLIDAINKNQNEFKFCLIDYLNYFMEETTTRNYFLNESLYEFSSETLYNVLNDLFKSRIKPEFKELAFILLNNFIKLYQFEFIYMKNRNFFYLLIHLLCIDIGSSLQVSTKTNEPIQKSNYNETYIFKSLVDKMSIYYSLIEEVIIILSTASPFDPAKSLNDQFNNEDKFSSDENDDDDDDEENYEPELKKVIKIIVEVLEVIILYVKDSLNELESLGQEDLVLVIASIRLLICWLAHESILEQDLIELMPKIVQFAEYYESLEANKLGDKVNVFEFLIPGLERVVIDYEEKLEAIISSSESSSSSSSSTNKNKPSKTKTNDKVKLEFEKSELEEQIENLQIILDKCYSHTKK